MRISDWSSDVCSSDLFPSYLSFITGLTFDELSHPEEGERRRVRRVTIVHSLLFILGFMLVFVALGASATAVGQFLRSNRSEERSVVRECVNTCKYRWAPVHSKSTTKKQNRPKT